METYRSAFMDSGEACVTGKCRLVATSSCGDHEEGEEQEAKGESGTKTEHCNVLELVRAGCWLVWAWCLW